MYVCGCVHVLFLMCRRAAVYSLSESISNTSQVGSKTQPARGWPFPALSAAPSSQLIPLFVLSEIHLPSPGALCCPVLVDVVHRE